MIFKKITLYNASLKPFDLSLDFKGFTHIFGCRKKANCVDWGESFKRGDFYINKLIIRNCKLFDPYENKDLTIKLMPNFDFKIEHNWAYFESTDENREPFYLKIKKLGFDGHIAKESIETIMIYDKTLCELKSSEIHENSFFI